MNDETPKLTRLRWQRESLGYTQRAVAERAGVSTAVVSLAENPRRTGEVSWEKLHRIAEALHLRPEETIECVANAVASLFGKAPLPRNEEVHAEGGYVSLRAQRARLGLTQAELARRAGVSTAVVSCAENPRHLHKVSWEKLHRLAEAVQLRPEETRECVANAVASLFGRGPLPRQRKARRTENRGL
jgi:transcriptional regulator with XRE-family HTH domain